MTRRGCPPWCTDHVTRSEEYAGEQVEIESHSGDFYSSWTPAGSWTFWLRLSQVEIVGEISGPRPAPLRLVLMEAGSTTGGRSLGSAQARELAAALMRCADLVDDSLTATCVSCGERVTPDEQQGCLLCRTRAVNRRREAMTLIPGGDR